MFALERPSVMARGVHQGVEIKGRKVCQGVHFEIAPDIFNGIEFRCVGREKMRMQARVALKKLARDLRENEQQVRVKSPKRQARPTVAGGIPFGMCRSIRISSVGGNAASDWVYYRPSELG